MKINWDAFSLLLRYGRKNSGPWDEELADDEWIFDDHDIDKLKEAWEFYQLHKKKKN